MDLREIQKKIAGRETLEAESEALIQKRYELEAQLKREKLNLEYERSDVESLETNTLKAFFYSALGKKEERLIKEAREAEEAKQKYESTLAELQRVNERIKRIEFELRELKRTAQDYKNLVKDLSVQVKEIEPRLSDADAVALEAIQKELAEQEQNQAYFAQIIEAGETLKRSIEAVNEALQEMVNESRNGTVFGKYEAWNEAKERRKVVLIQTQRFQDLLAKGVMLVNDYCIDTASVDNMMNYAHMLSNDMVSQAPLVLSDTPSITANLQGILVEMERKIERSKRHQAAMEIKLSEFLRKYQTM